MATTNSDNPITYEYDHVFQLGNNETATLEVIIVSTATEGSTTIITQKRNTFNIPNKKSATSVDIGTGNDLYGKAIISSEFDSVSTQTDAIEIQYKINGQLVADHKNPISEQPRPIITVIIQFISPQS